MSEAQEIANTPAQGRALQVPEKGITLRSMLGRQDIKGRFEEVLGKRAAGFISSIVSAVSANKELTKADPMTIISSASVAASLELPINQSLGFAHIVPYGGQAQFQIGWKGIVQLALRSGQYKTINLTVVRQGQIKYHNEFTGEMEFNEKATSPTIIGYLLYFRLLNGYEKYVYMTTQQCHDHGKRYSKAFAKGFGPWKDNFDAMALKTVAKLGLSKYGPMSVEMVTAMELDQAVVREDGTPEYIDVPAETISESETAPTASLEADSTPSTPPQVQKRSVGKSVKNHAPGAQSAVEQSAPAEAKDVTPPPPPANQDGKTRLVAKLCELGRTLKLDTNAKITARVQQLVNKNPNQCSTTELEQIIALFETEIVNAKSK